MTFFECIQKNNKEYDVMDIFFKKDSKLPLEETNEEMAAEEVMEDVAVIEEEPVIALYLCEEDEEECIKEEQVVED